MTMPALVPSGRWRTAPPRQSPYSSLRTMRWFSPPQAAQEERWKEGEAEDGGRGFHGARKIARMGKV